MQGENWGADLVRHPRRPARIRRVARSRATLWLGEQRELAQSASHEEAPSPWKNRSRSTIETRPETNSARPSADRGSVTASRHDLGARHGGKQNPNGRAPIAPQDARIATRPGKARRQTRPTRGLAVVSSAPWPAISRRGYATCVAALQCRMVFRIWRWGRFRETPRRASSRRRRS